MSIITKLSKELNIDEKRLIPTIELLDGGDSVPFISRYRKEVTGGLTDEELRNLLKRLTYLRNLEARKEEIKSLIDGQGKLTEELVAEIDAADVLSALEDIYRPYKPKRNTRGSIARERGYEVFANMIAEEKNIEEILEAIKNFKIEHPEDELEVEEILQGAKDIEAENISDSSKIREMIKKIVWRFSSLKTTKKEENHVYEMYYDFEEKIKDLKFHNTLAINRGEKDDVLKVEMVSPMDIIISNIKSTYINSHTLEELKTEIIEDSLKRLIMPSIEREIRSDLTQLAETASIELFGENLHNLLMIRPLKDKNVLALDPGIKTGTKASAVDKLGNFKEHDVLFIAGAKGDKTPVEKKLMGLIKRNDIDVIAIGNGTASREVESFVADFVRENELNVSWTIVSEAGASIYSASEEATEEFPDLDVTVRGAISIGRRLQDPLAELVKIEPKHIGVGQYQHDLNEKNLDMKLHDVVETCVNTVGVNLNTASVPLLKYVSGINNTVATNIVKYRNEVGRFNSRKDLKNIKGLGPKAFEQSAGFLRILDGEEILDSTAVHPESYEIAKKLKGTEEATEELANELGVGLFTLRDILEELKKPGRDPREDLDEVFLKSDILTIEDLKIGDILKGTVRNVVDFGCFVDIGLHSEGLIHISNLAKGFVKHPKDIVSVGDIVNVEVISIDIKRERVGLKKLK